MSLGDEAKFHEQFMRIEERLDVLEKRSRKTNLGLGGVAARQMRILEATLNLIEGNHDWALEVVADEIKRLEKQGRGS